METRQGIGQTICGPNFNLNIFGNWNRQKADAKKSMSFVICEEACSVNLNIHKSDILGIILAGCYINGRHSNQIHSVGPRHPQQSNGNNNNSTMTKLNLSFHKMFSGVCGANLVLKASSAHNQRGQEE